MYTWTNQENTEAWEANFSECCKHKWTIQKFIKVDGHWKRTDIYKRFDRLEDAKQYALNDLQLV